MKEACRETNNQVDKLIKYALTAFSKTIPHTKLNMDNKETKISFLCSIFIWYDKMRFLG